MTALDLVLTPLGLRFMGRLLPCTIGRGGVRVAKTEGDGATPAGKHRLVGMLYRPDRMASPSPWAVPIRSGDLWSDDPQDVQYNSLVKAPHAGSHERLARADPLYDMIILTDWNWPKAIPGAGSAIFIHRWRRPGYPTEGCVGMAPQHLNWIAARVGLKTRLIVGEGSDRLKR